MTTDVSLIRGDSRTLTITISDEAGDPVDVSAATAITYGIFAIGSAAAVITKTLDDGIAVVTSTVTVTIEPDDTEGLEPGGYVHECQVITDVGDVYTVLQGVLSLIRDFIP